MSEWTRLADELDQWCCEGRMATLWWRDDDAVTVTPAFERLLELHRHHGVTPALAVIPAPAEDTLVAKLESHPQIAVLQHGYAHKNYASEGERAIEVGGRRHPREVIGDMEVGRDRLAGMFPDRFLPVMVPPWNRVAPGLLAGLRDLGFRALSTFAARSQAQAVPGMHQTNCHLDVIDWRAGRCFRGEARLLRSLCDQLLARRTGSVDAREPTGVLSHHLAHDEACWRFLGALLEFCARHPAVRWLEPARACLEE